MNTSGKGSQADFLFEIKGAPAVEVVHFQAVERISEPYVLNADLASSSEIPFDDVIQKEALLSLSGAEANRYFHGIVRKFEHAGKSGEKHLYQAEIVPSMMLLSLEQDCCIFQNKDVQKIIADVFQEAEIGRAHV
jgi:type VI secretion system secreted protein VgrG